MRPHWIALQPEPAAQADEPEALRVWAWRALRVTPLVAQVDAALVLEVSASVRLFGGGAALLQALLHDEDAPAPVASTPRMAQGRTALVALARLQLPPLPRTAPSAPARRAATRRARPR